MKVQFKRELKGVIHTAEVYIDHHLVSFGDQPARRELDPDRDYVVDWRLVGDTGGSAKVTMTAGGVVETLFDATLQHSDAGRLSNGRILRLKGVAQ